MVSCVNHDIEPMSYEQSVTSAYNKAFVETFGQPSPSQTWGFGTTVAMLTTRSANTNANQWGETWDCVPNVNLTADELAELKALLSPGIETYNTDIFPYENYWVSQVYKGQAPAEEYTATDKDGKATGTKITGSNQMDKIVARNGSSYEHVNNFNNGNNTNSVYDQNFTDPNTGSHNHIGTTLMTGMSLDGITATNQFGFHESFCNADYNNYLIVYYKGYWYVGFDYEMHKNVNNSGEAKDVNRDWCFTDWIVRITPAYAKGTTPKDEWDFLCRVFAEDLSANKGTDFDFNDVVFDVYTNGTDAKVQLLAAGGTLPLTVAGYEVHGMFGVDTDKMINTGAGAHYNNLTAEPFIVKGVHDKEGVNEGIEIFVQKETEWIMLRAERGLPAAKFATSEKVQWVDERVDIKTVYGNFQSWVNTGNPEKWWNN